MKQLSIFIIFSLFVIFLNSCDTESGNQLVVSVTNDGKPVENVNVFVRELFPIEEEMEGIKTVTNKSGEAIVNDLRDDVYDVWITYPGFEEVRQRLPIKNKAKVLIKTSLVPKTLPAEFNDLFAAGSFNNWDFNTPAKLKKNDKNIWQVQVESNDADSAVYILFFDEPYLQFYNPESKALKYITGQQPPYRSIVYRENNNFLLTFDETKYSRSEIPYLNHWVERDIIGIEAQEFILFEKLITDNYQELSKTLARVNKISENVDMSSQVDVNELFSKLNEVYNQPELSAILNKIKVFSDTYDDEIFELAKIELAKINLMLGHNGNAKKIAEEVGLNSFAGGEAYNIVSMNFMKLPAGFAELSRKKLLETNSRKTRYAILKKLLIAYDFLDEEDKLEDTIDIILEEFPKSKLAENGRKLLEKPENTE